MYVEVYWSHSYLPELIRSDGLVFDFGLNEGGFSRLVAPKCRKVIGYEPDPSWDGKHLLPRNVQVQPKALAARAGKMKFHVNAGLCPSLHYFDEGAKSVEVEAVTLADALGAEPEGRIDLLKIDIEGEEIPVLLEAPRELFDRVVQMTVEFHDFLDPSSRPAIEAVISRMRGLGYHYICFSAKNYGDVLFVSRKLAPLRLWQRVWILIRYKYVRGLERIVTRWLRP